MKIYLAFFVAVSISQCFAVANPASTRASAPARAPPSVAAPIPGDNYEFIKVVFPEDNLGPKLPGGLRKIKDVRKVDAILKKVLLGNDCEKDDSEGWGENDPVVIQGYQDSDKGRIRIFHFSYCEPAHFADVAMFQPARSNSWYLIPEFMNEVTAAQTFDQWGSGDSSIVILGSYHWDGGGRSPAVIHITLEDDKANNPVRATKLLKLKMPAEYYDSTLYQ